MLINLTNHPSYTWSDEQIMAFEEKYGEIVDLPFPNVPPRMSKYDVDVLAWQYVKKCDEILSSRGLGHDEECPKRFEDYKPYGEEALCVCKLDAVHLMGEMSFCYSFIAQFPCEVNADIVVSTTERNPDGGFSFVAIR